MTREIIECEQGTPEWYQARLGIPTSSMFATVLAKGKGGDDSRTRKTYMLKLAGEIVTGEPMTNYVSAAMERGKVMEEEARDFYSFLHDEPLQRVGFIRNGQTGCSPDSLIGANGMLEIKTAEAHILADLILKDKFPPEHMAQVQGALWVAERDWLDLVVYWPKMPLFVKRIGRDEDYITALKIAVDAFNAELAEIVAKVRGYGQPKPPKVHRHWSELDLKTQAGIRCADKSFWRFLQPNYQETNAKGAGEMDAECAAMIVRTLCGVKSRAELDTDDAAGVRWVELNRAYETWLRTAPAADDAA
jgi:hypothetical protein